MMEQFELLFLVLYVLEILSLDMQLASFNLLTPLACSPS